MSGQRALQSLTSPAEQSQRRLHRAYTVPQLCTVLELPRSTFFHLRKKGQLPFLEELRPRLGRTVRYRADLVDRWLAGDWGGRSFRQGAR
jgi:excisionase family DNA binding protein